MSRLFTVTNTGLGRKNSVLLCTSQAQPARAFSQLGAISFVQPCIIEIFSPSIVIVSSLAHENGQINWEDINWEKSYDEWKAYSQSKLANVLHGVELAKKLENTGISVYSLHPGM